jgi:hypothetical protein
MKQKTSVFTKNQIIYKDMLVGTLIYAVVLGFYNDYTDIFSAKSFSTIFLTALVMQILTYITFKIKDVIVKWLKTKEGLIYKIAMFFFVWLVMFFSKFVFLWVIDILFGSYVTINGFIGLIAIIVTVTVLDKLASLIFFKLGTTENNEK